MTKQEKEKKENEKLELSADNISADNTSPEKETEEKSESISEEAANENENEADTSDESFVKEDIKRLKETFPDIKQEDIPNEVWESVKKGESLSGAYALYFVKQLKAKADIERINELNRKKAPPKIKHDGGDETYFSPEEVRSMSEAQVRKHYNAILASMDNWKK